MAGRVAVLHDLVRLAGVSAWLLPARKMETRMLPHIDPNTYRAADPALQDMKQCRKSCRILGCLRRNVAH